MWLFVLSLLFLFASLFALSLLPLFASAREIITTHKSDHDQEKKGKKKNKNCISIKTTSKTQQQPKLHQDKKKKNNKNTTTKCDEVQKTLKQPTKTKAVDKIAARKEGQDE